METKKFDIVKLLKIVIPAILAIIIAFAVSAILCPIVI